MWYLLLILTLCTLKTTHGICPAKCRCNEDALQVSCTHTGLEVVPIQLNPAVQHINLANNKISNVHYTLTFYNNLQTLDVSGNRINALGSSNFETQSGLKHLNLSYNEVEKIQKDSFKGLYALVTLDLSNNRIEEISVHAFRDLHLLELLDLSENQISYLEYGLFKPTTFLRTLLLSANSLLDVPSGALTDANNLITVSLSKNLIATIEENEMPNLPELQTLYLDDNVLNEIHPLALSGLSSLETLDLSNNNFSVIPTAALAKLSNLTSLKLSGNFVEALEAVAFKGLFQLRFLYLDRLEFLTRLDTRTFVDNINLEYVYLDDNIVFANLPVNVFHGNPRISFISIRNNQLSTLEVLHFPIDHLSVLRLGGNPFNCNCSLLWLWRLEQEQIKKGVNNSDLLLEVDTIICAQPEQFAGKLLYEISESKISCSISWIGAVSGVSLALFIIVVALLFLYFGPMKRRKQEKRTARPTLEPRLNTGANLRLSYEDPRTDKYNMIGPPNNVSDYQTLPTWDPFAKESVDPYRPFDNNMTTSRPHVVYV